jgi:hypothetical protein
LQKSKFGPVTFFNITDPFNMETTPEPENHDTSTTKAIPRFEESGHESFAHVTFDEAPGLEALSAAATNSYNYTRPLSNSVQSPGGTILHHPSSNKLNFILNPAVPEGSLGMYRCFRSILTSTCTDFLLEVLAHRLRLTHP